jgi:endo-1,4-beta-xylanase
VDSTKNGTATVTIKVPNYSGEVWNTSDLGDVTQNKTIKSHGYDFEMWNQDKRGTASMTLGDGGTFKCSWSGIENVLFRAGRKYNRTQTHSEIGVFSIEYDATFAITGGDVGYLSVYGWVDTPLIEYYIVENWHNYRPPGGTVKATVTIDGGSYQLYEATRTNQPSINGTQTFQQYWSVRVAGSKRSSGTVSVSQHFEAWKNAGMTGIETGKLYEVALKVEGYSAAPYPSAGNAQITKNVLKIDGVPIDTP